MLWSGLSLSQDGGVVVFRHRNVISVLNDRPSSFLRLGAKSAFTRAGRVFW
jgi:hypothetical protein